MTPTCRALALGVPLGATAFPALAQDLLAAIRIGSTAPGHLAFILSRDMDLRADGFAADGIPVGLVTVDGGSAASVARGSGGMDLTHPGNDPALRLGADVVAMGLSSRAPTTRPWSSGARTPASTRSTTAPGATSPTCRAARASQPSPWPCKPWA